MCCGASIGRLSPPAPAARSQRPRRVAAPISAVENVAQEFVHGGARTSAARQGRRESTERPHPDRAAVDGEPKMSHAVMAFADSFYAFGIKDR